jgi:thiol-disulfide isomerase/thioredoxin
MTKWIGVVALGVGIVAAGLYWSSERDATPEGVAMDWSAVEALRTDQMRKLMFHSVPQATTDAVFLDEDGGEMTLADLEGGHVVLNFWATWCAPCRKEMPSLANLQAQMGSDGFRVVTVASGRNPPEAIDRFFTEEGIEGLPKYRDPDMALSSGMAVAGLPITVILNPEGKEIARLRGDAFWDTDSAQAIIKALMDGS